MKKSIFFLLVLCLIPFISALSMEVKETYLPGETLIAEIQGSLLNSIQDSDFYFYRGHVQVPVRFDITQMQNSYYVYVILPLSLNNYTLMIKNLRYRKAGKEVVEDLSKNISVIGQPIFSVSPGFIFTNKSFSIEAENYNDIKIDLATEFLSSSNNFIIEGGEIKELEFDVGNESGLNFLKISGQNLEYKIPVLIYSKGQSMPPIETEIKGFRFDPEKDVRQQIKSRFGMTSKKSFVDFFIQLFFR
jgi:hypothetical protein